MNEFVQQSEKTFVIIYVFACESLGDPNPKEVEEKELVASIYWWLFNEISGERIIRFESFMNSLFHLGYMILIELNKVIK